MQNYILTGFPLDCHEITMASVSSNFSGIFCLRVFTHRKKYCSWRIQMQKHFNLKFFKAGWIFFGLKNCLRELSQGVWKKERNNAYWANMLKRTKPILTSVRDSEGLRITKVKFDNKDNWEKRHAGEHDCYSLNEFL